MRMTVFILAGLGVGGAWLFATGWWRAAFAPFGINARKMTVDRLGLLVPATDIGRVEAIFRSFAGGFNTMIAHRSSTAWEQYCDSVPVLFQPFAHEGAAMGYTLRHVFRYRPEGFEARLVKARPGFRYLYYVGLGFWWGMREVAPRRVQELVEGLDPLHRHLCFDGYGFKRAFFDEPRDASALRPLEEFEGYARNAAYQGVGRAYWFRFMGDAWVLLDRLRNLGDYAADGAAGAGLASAFVHPDRLESARRLAVKMPEGWQPHFHLGMCFGLKARSINDPRQFDQDMAGVHEGVRDAVLASIRWCDRIEQQVRAEQLTDGYRQWRALVTAWMAAHIEYPLTRVRSEVEASEPMISRDSAEVA